MRFLAFTCLGLLFFTGCSVSPTGSAETYGTQDQDWLVKLATYRVRDETIIKSQDKAPLNIEDLRDLIAKELPEEDLLDLIGKLGVSPKLSSSELSQLESLGTSPKVLRKLGQTPSVSKILKPLPPKTEPLMTKSAPKQKVEEKIIEQKKPTPKKPEAIIPEEKQPEKIAPSETKNRSRHPSELSSDFKNFTPPFNDPQSRR